MRQLAEKLEELEIAKNPQCILPRARIEVSLHHQHLQAFRIWRMCKVFGVSRSAYYVRRQRGSMPFPRRRRQSVLDQRVAHTYQYRKGYSGAPRLTIYLVDDGLIADRKTVAASLRRQALRAKAARKFKPQRTRGTRCL